MNIDAKRDGATLVLRPEGRLDTTTSPLLQDALDLDGVTELVFDFSALEYISSAGLRVLITAQKSMNAAGGTMEIRGANDTVRNVFDITGCSDIFAIR